jgi:hypothetical protein
MVAACRVVNLQRVVQVSLTMPRRQTFVFLLTTLCALYPSLSRATTSSKRGLAYVGDDHQADLRLLLSARSPISWYYTWSLNQAASVNTTVPFVPLVHSTDDATNSDLTSILNALPGSSTHLLTFNEPDGTTGSGGSAIDPGDAAQAYMNHIAPLRSANDGSRTWNISHPAVTGSSRGLEWLRQFNASCYKLDSKQGCPTDFVAVHWYGDFAGLASWVGTLRDFYANDSTIDMDSLDFWLTEMALPQGNEDVTVAMMNQSLSYLDGLDYVQGYAWFGAFRTGDANEWTGDEVSFFDNHGGLTDVGSLYLGGDQNGFAVGTEGGGNAAGHLVLPGWYVLLAGLAVVTILF